MVVQLGDFFKKLPLPPFTSINENLIKCISIILKTITCGYTVNTEVYAEYRNEAAEKYVELIFYVEYRPSMHLAVIDDC